jgi:uncharacterized peroxidase-related enzyme
MPISRFPIPDLDLLPADVKSRIDEVEARTGFVPNVFLSLARRPDEFRAFFALHDALMERESGLSKAEREMIVVATSAANDCLYCVVAHGAILRVRARDPELADRIAVNWRTAPLDDRRRAILAFAVKLARTPELVDEPDFAALRTHGLSEEDIWDVGAITALFAASNRLAHLADLQPNPEFFLLGRSPRSAT